MEKLEIEGKLEESLKRLKEFEQEKQLWLSQQELKTQEKPRSS